IRAVYGEAGHGWLDQVEKQALARANADAAVSTLKKYEQLLKERERISAKLRQEEVGAGATGHPPGHGLLWAAMRRELEVIDAQVEVARDALKRYGVTDAGSESARKPNKGMQ